MSDCKEGREKYKRGRERETLKEQSAALCLRTLSALTCSVWRQCNSKFYTVWDTNWHSELWLFLQYNLIKRHCQWGWNQSIIKFDRQTDIKVFAISQHTGHECKTSEPWLEEVWANWITPTTRSVVSIRTILGAEIWFCRIFSFEVQPKILWLTLDTMLWKDEWTGCTVRTKGVFIFFKSMAKYRVSWSSFDIFEWKHNWKPTEKCTTWQLYTEGKSCKNVQGQVESFGSLLQILQSIFQTTYIHFRCILAKIHSFSVFTPICVFTWSLGLESSRTWIVQKTGTQAGSVKNRQSLKTYGQFLQASLQLTNWTWLRWC